MAFVHSSTARSAPELSSIPDGTTPITCPLCRTVTAYEPDHQAKVQQCPCPACAGNLLVLNRSAAATDNERTQQAADASPDAIDLSQRTRGRVAASLAGLVNLGLCLTVGLWMFTQIKATHDPYDVDASLLSPAILSANDWTALHLAAARGDLDDTTALLQAGLAVDQRNGRQRTALYEAAKRGHTRVASVLLQHGADPNAQGLLGFTPLLAAAEFGHADTITELLAHGADLHHTCPCGDSALHRAVRNGQAAAALILLEQGIAVNDKSHGQTALELAQDNEDDELISILTAHGGKNLSAARVAYSHGLELHKDKKLDEALLAYADALAIDPDYASAHYSRGAALAEQQHLDAALIAFDRAVQLDPSLMDAYRGIAWIQTQRNQRADALATWNHYLLRHPNHGRAYYERGLMKRDQGDPQGFLRDLEQACLGGYRAAC